MKPGDWEIREERGAKSASDTRPHLPISRLHLPISFSSRRQFLRAAGVSLALPCLDAWAAPAAPRRRMVCICTPLGMHPPYFFPEKAGADYPLSPYLKVLEDLRQDFTVISGLTHPDVGPTHDSIFSFLTAAPHPENRGGFRNTISLDQVAAERLGAETRYPCLTLSCEGFSLAWTRSGALVPSEGSPSRLFAKLFLDGRPDEVKAQIQRLRDGRSILDSVRDRARSLQPTLGSNDREKVDEYMTSVRELEQRLGVSEEWSGKPKPKVDEPRPQDIANSADVIGKTRLMFDLIRLAVQTDSTRIITLMLAGTSLVPAVQGVTQGHHDLSHHGQDPGKIEQLSRIETEKMKLLHRLFTDLKNIQEEGVPLLDRTMIFFSSNLGNASSHAVKNLPILLAGGGFKHGRHLAFDPKSHPPLSNLYVSMLQRLGLEIDAFGSSTGPLTGLETA